MAMTDWTIIRRSMTARLFSTVTTVITVAVAVALMLVLLSMREAGEKAFARGGGNMHLLVSNDRDSMTAVLNGLYYARPQQNYISWGKFNELASWIPWQDPEKNPKLENGFFIPTQQGDSFRGFPVLATTDAFFTRFTPTPGEAWKFAEGKAFAGDFEVVFGAAAAQGTRIRVGSSITLTHGTPDSRAGAPAGHEHDEYKFKVVGILKPSGTSHDRGVFTNLQSAWIIHAHDRIERAAAKEAAAKGEKKEDEHSHDGHDHDHGPTVTAADLIDEDRKITGVYLRLVTAKGSNTSAALPQVFDRLRKDGGLTVAQPKQEIDNLFKIVGNINQILVAMAAVVMVSSGIAIMLALYNSMEQRRRQVAVLRVLGCSQGRVFGLVVVESMMLGVFGAVAGIAIAVIGGWIVAAVLKNRVGLVVDPGLSPMWVVGVAAGAIVLGAVAGLVPAFMAYRTPVARNLKPLG